ncbi:uncharacterized protein [Procambarus clarkii]|uniref:uncharacterized protein isoform X2 n=1 Tax=Procambarus clarkii TaxID=6728 RepID=UPI00374430DB
METCPFCNKPKQGKLHLCEVRCIECHISYTANSRRECVLCCPQCVNIPRGHYDAVCTSCSKIFCTSRRDPETCPFCMNLDVDDYTESNTRSDSETSEASSPQSERSSVEQLDEEYPRGGGNEAGEPSTSQARTPPLEDSNNSRPSLDRSHLEDEDSLHLVWETDSDVEASQPIANSPPPQEQQQQVDVLLPPQPEVLEVINNFNGGYIRHSYSIPDHAQGDPAHYLTIYRDYFIQQIESLFDAVHPNFPPALLIYPDFTFNLQRLNQENEPDFEGELPIRAEQRTVSRHEASVVVDQWIAELDNKLEEFFAETEGSSLGIQSISGFYINSIAVQHPIRLGEYVPYPDKLRGSRHIFNPKGEQNICLIQCLATYICLLGEWTYATLAGVPNLPGGVLDLSVGVRISKFP